MFDAHENPVPAHVYACHHTRLYGRLWIQNQTCVLEVTVVGLEFGEKTAYRDILLQLLITERSYYNAWLKHQHFKFQIFNTLLLGGFG